MANVDIRQGYKNAAWFASNPTLVLKQGQVVHLEQTGTYKLGDGTTQLSALSFLGGSSGGGQVDSVVGTTNRISVDNTDPVNPVINIDSAYDTAITNAISSAVSGKEDTANKKNTVTNSTTDYPSGQAVYNEFSKILPPTPIISGTWRTSLGVGNLTSGTWPAGSAWCAPYIVDKAHVVTAIRCHLSTSVAATTIRLALFEITTGNIPVNLLDESGAINAASGGIAQYTFTNPINLTKGLYWMSIQVSAGTVGIFYFQNGTSGFFSRASATPFATVRNTQSYGAFQNPPSSLAYLTGGSGNTPLIEMLVQ